jgi:hypothetical protein
MSRLAPVSPLLLRPFPLIAVAMALAISTPAFAQQPSDPGLIGIRVGFGDLYKVGHWTPVEIIARGGRQPMTGFVTVTVPDGDGTRSTVRSERPYQFLPGQQTRMLLYVKPGQLDADFVIRLVRDSEGRDEIAFQRFSTRYEADPLHPRQAIPATQELMVGLGPPIGLASVLTNRNLGQQPDHEANFVNLDSAAPFPTRWYGYDGVDWLILSTSRPEIFGVFSPPSAQLAALKQWVRLGGRLLLCVGDHAQEMLGPDAPFADFVPGRFVGTKTLRPARAFESYIAASEPLPETRGAAGGRLNIPQIADVRGRVEVQEGPDLPLVVRAPYGFGEVVFVAVDLDQPPFSRWSQRGRLVARLLGFADPSQPQDPVQQVYGFNDLSGQLRAGLDQFTGVKIAPFWLVALLIAIYIAFIGPVDYLLVKKVFKRMEMTWITFPTMVAAVTIGAYFAARWMKGDALLVNQVDVVDVDLSASDEKGPLVRGTSWFNVFSPQMQSYDVTVAPQLGGQTSQQAEKLVSWMGLPGGGYGGMGQATAEPSLFSRSYWCSPELGAMLGVPIQVWSTKTFTARWSAADPTLAGMVEANLQADFGDSLDGTLTSRLDFPLADCLLAYRGGAYPIGDLLPGEPASINRANRRRLATELGALRGAANPAPGVPPQFMWNMASFDVPDVVQRMMFYEAAGGFKATHLSNRYQRFVDLSNHLAMDQAILVGRADQPAAPLRLDGQPAENNDNRHWTLYRILLPVKPR